jgi:RND family efflux transporter MFP subunit
MKSTYTLLSLALLFGCSVESDQTAVPTAERSTSVTVAQPVKRDIDYVLTALGSVESIHHPTISAETNGQIVSVDISEGQPVNARQLLAGIDDTLHQIEAATAEAELQRQSVLLENQSKEVVRLKRLEESQSVSRDQLEDQEDQLAMLQAQHDIAEKRWEHALHMASKTRVLAPQAGLIARRHISLGDYVTPGTPLFDLVSVDKLKARLSFPEHDAASIAIGKSVQLVSPAAPGVVAIGEVTGINPQINVYNRAIEVTVEFDNPGGWLPGSSVDATLVIDEHANALTLPPTSVVTRSDREVVFVVEGERATIRPVTVGWREVDWVEITAGVRPDDRVVVKGAALISDGSLLTERP